MKIFTKISIVLAAVVVLAACKYEEGPGISLRSKRDRVSNEWKFDKFTGTDKDGNDTDLINSVVSDNPMMKKTIDDVEEKGQFILSIFRTGSYGINFVMPGGRTFNIISNDLLRKDTNALINTMTASFPPAIDEIRNSGTWSFDHQHSNIQLHPDLSYDSTGTQDTYDWEIVKLKEKELKTRIKLNDVTYNMTFLPLNDENFWW